QTKTHSVAALADELLDCAVGCGVDASQRGAKHSDPDRTAAERDVAAPTRRAGLNRLRHLVGLHVDLRDGPVALMQHPLRSLADREESWRLACWDCLDDEVGGRIDAVQDVLGRAGRPDSALTEIYVERSGRQADLGNYIVVCGIDAHERAALVGNHP